MKNFKNFLTYWSYLIYYYVTVKIKQIKYSEFYATHIVNKCFIPDAKTEYDARMFVLLAHHKVRQRYDGRYPYYFHLNMVTSFVIKFINVLDPKDRLNAILGALGHDLIEDVHYITYNNVVEKWGVVVADIIFACTELRGKNRAERHGPIYYKCLQLNEIGAYDKINDVIANMTMGSMTGSSMLKKYRKDYPKFKELLHKEKFEPMFKYIESNLLYELGS